MKIKSISKKGVGFFSLTPLFMIIMTVFIFLGYNNNLDSAVDDINFGEATISSDFLLSRMPNMEFYKKEEMRKILENAKLEFADMDSKPSCKFEGYEIPVWHNQKYIDERAEALGEKSANDITCMPDFEENIINAFSKYLEKELEKSISEGTNNDIEPLIKVTYNDQNNIYEVKANTYYRERKDYTAVALDIDTSIEYDAGLFPELIETLSEKVPILPKELPSLVPRCVKDNIGKSIENIENYCIEKNVEELFMKDSDPKLWESYDVEIEILNDISDEKYYAFKVNIINKILGEKELEFGVSYKDNIPFYYVNFYVENVLTADNMARLTIERPVFSSDSISNYIVLYGNQDFLNSNEYPSYSKLVSLLENSQVPDNFKDTGYDNGGIKYYHSEKADNLNLNMLVVSKENFEKDSKSGADKKDLIIYQEYDFTEETYKKLDSKPYYFFVFAVDTNFNYYIDELENQAKELIIKSNIGPEPLVADQDSATSDNLFISSNVGRFQSSLSIEIKDYTAENFDHYDIYVAKSRTNNKMTPQCAGAEFECYYYNGEVTLRQISSKILLTSDGTITQEKAIEMGYDRILKSMDFMPKNKLVLLTGERYEVMVIPVDSNGNAVVSTHVKEYELSKTGDFYNIENEQIIIMPGSIFETIKDNSPPHPLDSFSILSPQIQRSGTTLFLQWTDNPNDLEKVISLKTTLIAYNNEGKLKYTGELIIESDGEILDAGLSISRIELKNIIPIDSEGNSYDISEVNAETLKTVEYTIPVDG